MCNLDDFAVCSRLSDPGIKQPYELRSLRPRINANYWYQATRLIFRYDSPRPHAAVGQRMSANKNSNYVQRGHTCCRNGQNWHWIKQNGGSYCSASPSRDGDSEPQAERND